MIKKNRIIYFSILWIVWVSCSKEETATGILQKTIQTIDTIETVYFKQDMFRSNPQNPSDTIQRYREMYFKRLISDSIVGVKGHWYMYLTDKENVIFEDIYDGNRLIRKNNRDSTALIYDLVKYPEFKKRSFWGHNTPYGMQAEFRYMLQNPDTYTIERLKDSLVNEKNCFVILVTLKDKITMPGFAARLEDRKGNISETYYYIDKTRYYPIKMKGESYSADQYQQKFFIEQLYYDIRFNLLIDEDVRFNTSDETILGYEPKEMKPE
jgi:hypothetical protein